MLGCIQFFLVLLLALIYLFRWICRIRRDRRTKPTVAFFHPYCNAGGGGERVLWCAIRALQKRHPSYSYSVYTGDTDANPDEIVRKASERFNIYLTEPVNFVFLRSRKMVEARMYPVFTLLGQTVGGFFLGLEALLRFPPDVFVDSMGYPATLFLFRLLGGARVACYVHYPTISTDMLNLVASRAESYNNASVVSRNPVLSRLKLVYYRLFAAFYGVLGKASHVTMVNSTWTQGHIAELWAREDHIRIVYPPCDVDAFRRLPVVSEQLLPSINILSIGQFRPEKDHSLQLRAFALLCDGLADRSTVTRLRLVLAGSCRHEEDKKRVERLKKLADELGVSSRVEWMLNVSHETLKMQLTKALIGLHTMWNEHFGIGVVEGMAAGNIMIAHDSGGPKMDIVRPAGHAPLSRNTAEEEMGEQEGADGAAQVVGFLASTAEAYAECMEYVIGLEAKERDKIREAARRRTSDFSEENFDRTFLDAIEEILSGIPT